MNSMSGKEMAVAIHSLLNFMDRKGQICKITCLCLLQENFVSLQGLLFSCKYKVLLQPISKKSRPLAESTSFFTPSCATIQAKNPKLIPCPGETGDTTGTSM